MKASGYFTAKTSGNTITLEVKNIEDVFKVIAATMPYCPATDMSFSDRISLTLPPGQSFGLIAILAYVRSQNVKTFYYATFLLPVSRKEHGNMGIDLGNIKIDLDNIFVPDNDQLGQISHRNKLAPDQQYLDVIIEGKTFTADYEALPGEYFVPDPDLLCRYLAGLAGADDVKKAAQETAAEISELERMEEALAAATRNLAAWTDRYREAESRLTQANQILADIRDEVKYGSWWPLLKCFSFIRKTVAQIEVHFNPLKNK